jgi:hypothetical protein
MLWATMQTGDPVFYEAWLEAYRPQSGSPSLWDHGANKIVTNLSAQRHALWEARLASEGVTFNARTDLAGDLHEATVSSPDGPVRIRAADSAPTASKYNPEVPHFAEQKPEL